MVSMMTTTPVQWTAPAPLWPELTPAGNGQRTAFHQPAILRFGDDDFMETFMGLLAEKPQRLAEWQAMPETWRGPATEPIPVASLPSFAQRLHRLRLGLAAVSDSEKAGPPALNKAMIPAGKLKLYQPAHQRYYLVAANLVCRVSGLPDRLPDSGAGEQTGYVVRRLLPLDPQTNLEPTSKNLEQFEEYAFVVTAAGPRWQRLGPVGTAATQLLAPNEDELPLFGVGYAENGRSRRLVAGVIPVAKRETYVGTAVTTDNPTAGNGSGAANDGRLDLLLADVIEPWRRLLDAVAKNRSRITGSDEAPPLGHPDRPEFDQMVAEYNQSEADQIQGASWYILLDLATFLTDYLPAVHAGLDGSPQLPPAQQDLLNLLQTETGTGGKGLAAALSDIEAYREMLENTAVSYPTPTGSGWPFLFSLSDLSLKPDELETAVAAALKETAVPANTPPPPLAAQLSTAASSGPAWFIIRCLFTRPHCLDDAPQLFSQPTEPFQLASFFDPDAPARPIRISLPLDTSPAGLRKFNKNTAFMISDVLACQLERMGDITLGDLVRSVLPWPLHKSLPANDSACSDTGMSSFGLICSLSIPIITLCALILLMIMVTLLDFIFRWLPYFIVCYPIPGLKGKEQS
jgi:hypothetical protein